MLDVTEEFIKTLQALGLLSEIDAAEHGELVRLLTPTSKDFLAGEVICAEGEPGTRLYIVRDRGIELYRTHNGRESRFKIRPAPALTGEGAFFHAEKIRNATVRASGPLDTWEISYQRLVDHAANRLVRQFVKNLQACAAERLNESVDDRAREIQKNEDQRILLRRFVNDFARASQDRPGEDIKTTYAHHRAIVLFSDVVGFTTLSKLLGPENTAIHLNRVLEAQTDAIQGSKGHIDKFIGDAVMAFWIIEPETEAASREAAYAAVSCALSALEKIAALEHPAGDRFMLRVGMHIGEVAADNFGTKSRVAFTLIGDTVNYAARLEQYRGKDEPLGPLRISTELYQLLAPEIQAHFPARLDAEEKRMPIRFHHKVPNGET